MQHTLCLSPRFNRDSAAGVQSPSAACRLRCSWLPPTYPLKSGARQLAGLAAPRSVSERLPWGSSSATAAASGSGSGSRSSSSATSGDFSGVRYRDGDHGELKTSEGAGLSAGKRRMALYLRIGVGLCVAGARELSERADFSQQSPTDSLPTRTEVLDSLTCRLCVMVPNWRGKSRSWDPLRFYDRNVRPLHDVYARSYCPNT
eukprot:COSAG05_NODE_4685_length_1411_cov_1.227134_1_plen_202_part_10